MLIIGDIDVKEHVIIPKDGNQSDMVHLSGKQTGHYEIIS